MEVCDINFIVASFASLFADLNPCNGLETEKVLNHGQQFADGSALLLEKRGRHWMPL